MTGRLRILDTPLEGLKSIHRDRVEDDRGFLDRLFCTDELGAVLAGRQISQINRTLTVRCGAVRGMHFQKPPHAEAKFVTCLRGEVFDVAVDLRASSPTLLKWHGELLTGDNQKTLMIPEGFAHGFQALTDNCEMLYIHTSPYAAHAEGGLSPRDPRLAIAWPREITELSSRDASHAMLTGDYLGMTL